MEYEILGVPENCDVKDAKKALKKIQVDYHPDKHLNASPKILEKNLKFVILAEKAFERIQQKKQVDDTVQNLLSVNNNLLSFATNSFIRSAFQNSLETFNNIPSSNVSSYSYSYTNMNGVERESGTINGRKMNKDELSRFR